MEYYSFLRQSFLCFPVDDCSSFSCVNRTAASVFLCNVFVNISSEGQLRLSSSCVLPKTLRHSFFGDPHTPGRGHLVPVAFKEKD